MTAPAAPARAPVPSLGVVLAGCPDCRAVLGVDGDPGLAGALAAHRRACPAADDVCAGCGCEAELYPRGDRWRCADCLGQWLVDDLPGSASQPAHDPPRAGNQEPHLRYGPDRAPTRNLAFGRLLAPIDSQEQEPRQPERGLDRTHPDLKPSHAAKPAHPEASGQIGRDAA
jgi:hypothetical protein